MFRPKLTLCLMVFATLPIAADAAETNDQYQVAATESADKFVKAFTDRDAGALADLFTPEAEYVDDSGTVFHGRSVIEAEFAAAFRAETSGTMEIDLTSIRPVAAGVFVEDGISTFTPKDGPPTQTRYTATHVKQADGKWLMASVRELETGRMTSHDRLTELEWLIGRWSEEVEGSVIRTQWAWSGDKNFLIGHFSVKVARDQTWKGVHRIGWDAERKQFRSWIFDSNGGSADGWWRSDDGIWTVALSGVDAEGIRVSSILSYERDGKDAIVISQDQRIRSGNSLPGSSHRVVKQPPDPSAEPKSTNR